MIHPEVDFKTLPNNTLITLIIVLMLGHTIQLNQSDVSFENHFSTVGTDMDFSRDWYY